MALETDFPGPAATLGTTPTPCRWCLHRRWSLVGSGGAQFWDFNTGAPGWSFSNSYASRVTSPACGLNGSAEVPSEPTQVRRITSPSIDLSGVPSMPLHVTIRQGFSSCGEEPDSNEDLHHPHRVQRLEQPPHRVGSPASNNTWTFFTWNLPSAARRTPRSVSTDLRIQHLLRLLVHR